MLITEKFCTVLKHQKGIAIPSNTILIMIITESIVKCNNNFDDSDNSFVIIFQFENNKWYFQLFETLYFVTIL